jgi:uncharacterized membrane protein (UPF0127 family)
MLPLLLLACEPTLTEIIVDQHHLRVEIAATEKARASGLMHRKEMAENTGMLFIYDDYKPRNFWMQDTHIALSIAFADRTGKIVKIANMAPLSTATTQSLYPAKYALEVNQGWFESHNIKVGAFIVLP